MKRRKVVAMLLAGTLTLSQPLAVFASEDFISDITSEQSGMDTEPDAISEDTGSSGRGVAYGQFGELSTRVNK